MAASAGQHSSQLLLDSEESKNIAVVHKTNQGYSGKDLWKLKQERPELFGAQAAGAGGATSGGRPPPPPGFEEEPRLGADWLYSRERDVYLNRETRKHYIRDPVVNELAELGQGRDMTAMLAVHGDAAASVGTNGTAGRHVIINDLHRAAQSMKLDFAHHDSPAAMFAVYDGRAASGGAAVAEAAAKSLHVRLLPRLAEFRGQWQNDRLERVLDETMRQLALELGVEAGVAAAVVLLLGGRLTLAASGGAACLLFGRDGMADGGMDDLDVVGDIGQLATHCAVLEDSHLGVLLTVEPVRSAGGLSPARMRALVRGHVAGERPRAACITVLGEARRAGVEAPLVAAAVRFSWMHQDAEAPTAKKARTDLSGKQGATQKLTKVRCRHILLRHSGCQAVADRGKPKATRSVVEAEEMLLRALPELAIGGATAFTAKCKKESECDTALRGGDLAGDLGWLDRDPARNRKVPASVVRAAFTLAVGQLSDIIASERGVHLLLRTA